MKSSSLPVIKLMIEPYALGKLEVRTCVIQWIPSHVGIEESKQSDDFANRGCNLRDIAQLKLTASDAKGKLHRQALRKWSEDYQFDVRTIGKNILKHKPQ